MFKIAMLLVAAGLVGCTRDVVTVVDAKAGTFLRRDKVLGGLYWCEKAHCELVTGTTALTALVATTPAPTAAPSADISEKISMNAEQEKIIILATAAAASEREIASAQAPAQQAAPSR